jgi:hypothetical protein
MEIEGVILSASITIFSLGLFIISLVSYIKYKNRKLFFVSAAFFFFLVKGITLSANVFFEEFTTTMFFLCVFDLVILILLFVSTLKR